MDKSTALQANFGVFQNNIRHTEPLGNNLFHQQNHIFATRLVMESQGLDHP